MNKVVKASILAGLLTISLVSVGATRYEHIVVPVDNRGAPCMVEFDRRHLNANLIQSVQVITAKYYKPTGVFSDPDVTRVPELQIIMVNRDVYRISSGDLQKQQDDFLKLLKTCRYAQ